MDTLHALDILAQAPPRRRPVRPDKIRCPVHEEAKQPRDRGAGGTELLRHHPGTAFETQARLGRHREKSLLVERLLDLGCKPVDVLNVFERR
jgi:hypothetical protein